MSTSIPALHVSDPSKVEGKGEIFIASRQDAASLGVFTVKLAAHFDPAGADVYPVGAIAITVDLNDGLKGTFGATSIELINSYGKANPTVYLTGRCSLQRSKLERVPQGLRYWLMIADNSSQNSDRQAPDVVGFAIHDRAGARVAYGAGPVRTGQFTVMPK
ncbi:hypothetical protein LJR175_007626 [Variovorax sp. LjRoot175]|uniref:hypothetical protein n=1 Tax=Variovorax sp. LjRoot175 TaxID=3342276 RepID=UPI003ECE4596